MKATDDLFQLIKSLAKSEKRYFKLFSSLHVGDKKYMLLFEAIAKQQQCDEQELLVRFKKERFVKQFWVAKNRLYNLILKSLEQYHSCVDSDLHSHLHRIKILFEKGLFTSCEKIITKAMLLAKKHEKFPLMMDLQEWKMKLIRRQSYFHKNRKNIDKIFHDSYSIIRQYKNVTEYSHFSSRLYMKYFEKGLVRNKKDLKSYDFNINVPAFVNEKNALSFHAKLFYYNNHGLYSLVHEDYKNLYAYTKKYKNLLEQYPHYVIEEPGVYLNSLHNLIFCQSKMMKYDEMFSTIQEMRNASGKYKIKSVALKCYITCSTNTHELEAYTNRGDFDKGMKLIKDAERIMNDDYWKNLSKLDELTWLFIVSRIYLSSGEYILANSYLNKILNKSIDGVRNDIQSFARILSLIVHFEMEKYDLLEYEIKSVQRFLYKEKRLYKIESIVLDFISKDVPKIHSDKALLKSFEVLLIKLKAIANDSFEQRAFDYFDFISWLESKIENRPFAEVVREKSRKRIVDC